MAFGVLFEQLGEEVLKGWSQFYCRPSRKQLLATYTRRWFRPSADTHEPNGSGRIGTALPLDVIVGANGVLL